MLSYKESVQVQTQSANTEYTPLTYSEILKHFETAIENDNYTGSEQFEIA
jgi:hypothetical protein